MLPDYRKIQKQYGTRKAKTAPTESNILLHKLNVEKRKEDKIIGEVYSIYKNLLSNAKKLDTKLCSICKGLKNPEKYRTHFHGSEFGQCYRKTQYDIISPKERNTDDVMNEIFLYDGHLHEKVFTELLLNDYEISNTDVELEVIRSVKLPNGENINVRVIIHSDLILQTNKRKFVLEFKSVKQWTWKNRVLHGIIPQKYYGQCQIYMETHNIDYALLFFKARDSSEIHLPFIIEREPIYINRRFTFLAGITHAIKHSKELVPREFFDKECDSCKFCNHKKQCWS